MKKISTKSFHKLLLSMLLVLSTTIFAGVLAVHAEDATATSDPQVTATPTPEPCDISTPLPTVTDSRSPVIITSEKIDKNDPLYIEQNGILIHRT